MAKTATVRIGLLRSIRPMRGGAVALLLLGADLALAVPALAQGLPLEFGVGVSRNSSPPPELSEQWCAADVAWAAEGRVGLRLSRSLRLEATGGYHFEGGVSCAIPDQTIPPIGPFELVERTGPEDGFPLLSTDARVSFEPSQPAGGVWFRAFGGYGRMWDVGEGYWLAGGGLVFGGPITAVLELEWNWFDLPFDETVRTFQDGILTSMTSSQGTTSHGEMRIRAGFRFGF